MWKIIGIKNKNVKVINKIRNCSKLKICKVYKLLGLETIVKIQQKRELMALIYKYKINYRNNK